MKKFNISSLHFYLIFFLYLTIHTTLPAQDLSEVYERFRPEIEKIQNQEDAKNFVFTHARNEFELTEDIMTFLVALNGGAYTKQIKFLMDVPIQKWNPNIGPGGWGAYQIENARILVKKNVTTAFHNVSNYASKISEGLKYYSLCSSILEALEGDGGAKLKSIQLAFEIVRDWMLADFPNFNAAIFSVGLINYSLDKFINTTLDEYNEYWWNKYSSYLLNKYPGFIQDWANPSMQGDMGKFLESRLAEFWDSADQFEQGAPFMYQHSEYARNQLGPSFAARYYRDYLHQSFLAWAKRNAEMEEANAWREAENNARALKELLGEIKMMKAAIEAAGQQMNEKTPISLIVIPNKVNLKAGESASFRAFAVFEDQSSADVTEMEAASWSSGDNSFTVTDDTEAGEQSITVTYMNLQAKAVVNVAEREDDKETQCGENQEWSPEEKKCVCIEGYEMIEELGKCMNINEVISDMAGEEPDTVCNEKLMAESLSRLREIIAESNLMSARFNNLLSNFMKSVNEKHGIPCNDQLIAAAYAGAKQIEQEMQDLEDEATRVSSELIVEAALCQLTNPDYDVSSIIGLAGQMGSPLGRISQGIAGMESELLINGCDQQEAADLGNSIAETTTDPEVLAAIQSGGMFQPPEYTEGGTLGAVAVVYDGMDAPMSYVTVAVNLNFSAFNFVLAKNAQEVQNFENIALKEGDRVQITVHGTSLNPSFTLLPSDFAWIDPETQQQTTPGTGISLFTMVIAIHFNTDEEVNRYEMIVGIGTIGYGIPGFPEGSGRELRF
ncbi:MAG: hypothetical protein JXR67_02785 [Bacteroidales bacterium]|nr:hypothetical protein [Bacteroidales bacterium]